MSESAEAFQKRIRELEAQVKVLAAELEKMRKTLDAYRRVQGNPNKVMMSVPSRIL